MHVVVDALGLILPGVGGERLAVECDHAAQGSLTGFDGGIGGVLAGDVVVVLVGPDAFVGVVGLHFGGDCGANGLQGFWLGGLRGEWEGAEGQEKSGEKNGGRSSDSVHRGLGCGEGWEVCVWAEVRVAGSARMRGGYSGMILTKTPSGSTAPPRR